ncbi:hypothetical protein ILUMI_18822 [Ignelater luminosus]|uniref:Uncharacterized protein n=1 Tax=Ignelater luminosus TaxID=2038154 RepID=A0A8K0CLR4_IGNLU|nr:hypothetical protein ILUMI_18822 [Ignelater luminosus]
MISHNVLTGIAAISTASRSSCLSTFESHYLMEPGWLRETGSAANKNRAELRILDEGMQIEVLEQFAATSTLSLRKASAVTGICPESVRKVIKLHKRIQFCEEMAEKIRTTPEIYILGDAVTGPLFIQQNLNGELYLELLQNVAESLIVQEMEN